LLILLSLTAVIAVGLILLLSKKDGGSTKGYMNAEQAPVITAELGPYKIAPIDPKGLAVEGQDQTIYAAGEGIDEGSIIDQSAMPESPMPRPGSEQAIRPGSVSAAPPGLPRDLMPRTTAAAPPTIAVPTPAAVPSFAPAAPVVKPSTPRPSPAKPTTPKLDAAAVPKPAAAAAAKPASEPPKVAPAPAAKKPGTVQLGAFSSEEKANAAWAKLANKNALAGFSKRVIAVENNGKTLYRLRGTGGNSLETCQKLKTSGDTCAVVE
jgi:cell division protein FtsN